MIEATLSVKPHFCKLNSVAHTKIFQ